MNSTIVTLAEATTLPGSPKDPPPAMSFFNNPLFIIMLGLLVMMILMSRGKKGEEKRQDMLKQMKKGDEIQTIGGVIGKIVDVRDDRVQVKVDETANTKMWFTRNAIHRVIDDTAETK